jgi:hypothetical protein
MLSRVHETRLQTRWTDFDTLGHNQAWDREARAARPIEERERALLSA